MLHHRSERYHDQQHPPPSSGGVFSSTECTASTICKVGSRRASSVSSEETYGGRSRQTGYQITSTDIHRLILCRERITGTDLDLDIFCGTLTDQKIMFLSHITDDCLIKIIPGDLDRSADNRYRPERSQRYLQYRHRYLRSYCRMVWKYRFLLRLLLRSAPQ